MAAKRHAAAAAADQVRAAAKSPRAAEETRAAGTEHPAGSGLEHSMPV